MVKIHSYSSIVFCGLYTYYECVILLSYYTILIWSNDHSFNLIIIKFSFQYFVIKGIQRWIIEGTEVCTDQFTKVRKDLTPVKILIIYLWLVMHRYRILPIFDNSILTSDICWYPIRIWYYIYLVVYDAFNDIFSVLIGIK